MSDVASVWRKSQGSLQVVGLNSADRISEVCDLCGTSLTNEKVDNFEGPYKCRPVAGHSQKNCILKVAGDRISLALALEVCIRRRSDSS